MITFNWGLTEGPRRTMRSEVSGMKPVAFRSTVQRPSVRRWLLLLSLSAGIAVCSGPLIENADAAYSLIPGSNTVVSPAGGDPGTPVTISGNGLVPGETTILSSLTPVWSSLSRLVPTLRQIAPGGSA
jgi:hypothetical protein